ncbi:MAG: histidine phosphatase family protein [Candidatus Latescibacterota bacterium]
MAHFYLVRHGLTDMVDRAIAGRTPDIHLNEQGRLQAEHLVKRFKGIPIDFICSSPLERALETAAPLAKERGLEVRICGGLNEIDFGDWTGWEAPRLNGERWEQFNAFRSGTRIPRGEMMLEVQSRMISELEKAAGELPEGSIVVVSHSDPIKSVVAHFAGIPLDLFLRLEISPASVSVVTVNRWGPWIARINDTGELRAPLSF